MKCLSMFALLSVCIENLSRFQFDFQHRNIEPKRHISITIVQQTSFFPQSAAESGGKEGSPFHLKLLQEHQGPSLDAPAARKRGE